MNLSIKKITNLNSKELDKLDKFVYDNNGLMYHTSEWLLDIFPNIFPSKNKSFVVFNDNKIVVVFPLFITENKILFQKKAYISPYYSSGFVWDLSLKDKYILEIVEFIKNYLPNNLIINFHIAITQNYNFYNFFSKGKLKYSHQIVELNKNFLNNCEGRFRTSLKKGIKFEVKKDKKIDIIKLVECNFLMRKDKMGIEIDKNRQFNLFKYLLKSKYSELFYICDNEKIISYAIILTYKNYAYYSESATLRAKEYEGSNNKLQFEIMNFLLSKNVKYYDLGLYNINNKDNFKYNIYKFKVSMGAKLVFVPTYTYFTNPLLKKANEL